MLYSTMPSLSPDTSVYVHVTVCVEEAAHEPLPTPSSSTLQLGDTPVVPDPPTINVATADAVSLDVNPTVTTSPTFASVLTLLFDEIVKPLKLDGAVLSNSTDPKGDVALLVRAPP